MTPGRQARCALRSQHWAAMGTSSASEGGHPYVSAVEFALSQDARPLVLLSRLAEHTRNLLRDPRVSLLVAEPGRDALARARLTLLGEARKASDDGSLLSRYLRYFPASRRYLDLGDFSLFAIEPLKARYIAGFGEIRWIAGGDLRPPLTDLQERETEVIAHMDPETVARLARRLAPTVTSAGSRAALVGVDCDGADLRVNDRMVRTDFPEPVLGAEAARRGLEAMGRET